MLEKEAGTVIFGESEVPELAPDPAMAKRRLGFYARNGARTAGYDTEAFGVAYKTLYWASGEMCIRDRPVGVPGGFLPRRQLFQRRGLGLHVRHCGVQGVDAAVFLNEVHGGLLPLSLIHI